MLIFIGFWGAKRGGLEGGLKALFSLLGPRWAQEAPRAHQDPSKRLPRASQEPPRALQDGFGDRFLVDFGWDFGCIFDRFGLGFRLPPAQNI